MNHSTHLTRILQFFMARQVRAMEISCEDVRKNLKDYREHRLGPPQKGQIERHLFYCPECIFHLALVTARSLEKEEISAGSK